MKIKNVSIVEEFDELIAEEKQFNSKVDKISVLAFDDQCTAANSCYPLISEIKELYQKSFKGDL